jgi:hypothetical protein
MRIIRFKPADSVEYRNYIDIGSTEREYYLIDFFLTGDQQNGIDNIYTSWIEYFKNEPIGSKMIIINYYLTLFMGWNADKNTPQVDEFREIYGEELYQAINNNLEYLLQFNDKWFEDKSWFFKGLDFTLDSYDIEKTTFNEEGSYSKIEFADGSAISFLDDDDDSFESFFIPEEEYLDLTNKINNIVNILQPLN